MIALPVKVKMIAGQGDECRDKVWITPHCFLQQRDRLLHRCDAWPGSDGIAVDLSRAQIKVVGDHVFRRLGVHLGFFLR